MFNWSKLNFILMKNCVKSNILGVLCFYHSYLVCYKCKIPCNYYTFLFTKKKFYAVFYFLLSEFYSVFWIGSYFILLCDWSENGSGNILIMWTLIWNFFEFVAFHDKGTKGLLHKFWAFGNTWAGWAYSSSNPANGLALFDQGIEIWPRL